ncbi:MAG: hypothetical protein WBD87_04370 [Candidatus Acidiferrales bacterium]
MTLSPKKTKHKVLIGFAIVLALSAFFRIHFVQTLSGGELFWDSEDAYAFIGLTDYGWRPSCLGFAGQVLKAMFPFGVTATDETHSSTLVLHVTPDSVQRYFLDNFSPSRPTPFHGVLYLGYTDGRLMKWSGSHVDPAGPAEAEKLHEYMISLPKGPPVGPYDHVEGWSMRFVTGNFIYKTVNHRTISLEKDFTLTIEIAGRDLTFVMNSGEGDPGHGEAYIDVVRTSQPPTRIWHLDQQFHYISRAEYNRIFAYQLGQEIIKGTISIRP